MEKLTFTQSDLDCFTSWRQLCLFAFKRTSNSHRKAKLEEYIQKHNLSTAHFVIPKRYLQIEKICPVCDISFRTTTGPKEKTTCSHSCANTFFRTTGTGAWDYRKKALDFYGPSCKYCKEPRKHVLQVHHIDGD